MVIDSRELIMNWYNYEFTFKVQSRNECNRCPQGHNVTPGNVVRGNQKLRKKKKKKKKTFMGKQTGECSCSCIILTRLQVDFGKSGNVVLNFIPFCAKEKMVSHGKTSGRFLI